jgi:NAD+ synthetase
MKTLNELIPKIQEWFSSRNLNHAVVGFSGGIDSATTAALLSKAGIPVTIVLCQSDMSQRRESDFNPYDFSKLYNDMDVRILNFAMPYYPGYMDSDEMNDAENEAALPILRNACFYAVVASLRAIGKKAISVGTVNFDEAAYLGFWGKASDAAQDFYPISHLHKSEVYALAKELGVPQEIINATPSGDLQWSGELNDYKMIGATYDQIEALVKFVDVPQWKDLFAVSDFIKNTVDNPKVFVKNITKNSFKYDLPFPGFHLKSRLEFFRREYYRNILIASMSLEMDFNYPDITDDSIVHKM